MLSSSACTDQRPGESASKLWPSGGSEERTAPKRPQSRRLEVSARIAVMIMAFDGASTAAQYPMGERAHARA